MDTTRLRRTGALLASAAMLASLSVATIAAPAAAQLSCDGLLATITDNDGNDLDNTVGKIEGTAGPDVIVGTDGDDIIYGLGGNDRICGGLGDDEILGGDGNDRLFGGSGDDEIAGLRGHDDIFGFAGADRITGGAGRDFVKGGSGGDTIRGNGQNDILKGNGGPDWIRGQGGNDRIDGGAATDDCTQGGGTGPVRHCERADLVVRISSPKTALEGTIKFKVRVTNRGPNAVAYILQLDEDNKNARCNGPQPWEPEQSFAPLKPGASRTRSFSVTCSNEAEGDEVSRVWVITSVVNLGRELRPANNGPRKSTTIIQ